GEAYSELFGVLDFTGTKLAVRGGWGVLTGAAKFTANDASLLLSSGAVPCNAYADWTAPETPNTSNYGVCVSPSTGRLYGYAWSPQYGWLQFSGNTPLGTIGTPPILDDSALDGAATFQATSAWRAELGSIIIAANSDVYAANESINVPFAVGENGSVIDCSLLSGVIIHKIIPGTSYSTFKNAANKESYIERTFLNNNVDYTFSCNRGEISLVLQGDIAKTPGMYWVSGDIFGTSLTSSTSTLPGVTAGDPLSYQILPAEPCWANCTATTSRLDVVKTVHAAGNDYPIADGQDNYTFALELYDRFGNQVLFSEPLWFDPTKPVLERKFSVVMDDRVSLVQILGEVGAAVKGNATGYQPLVNTSNTILQTAGTTEKTLNSLSENTNQMSFKLTALAPTNYVAGSLTEDNRLQLKDLRFTLTPNAALSLPYVPAIVREMTHDILEAS